jgi:2-C-methyl-D-erythritol 4-phosphate cytidylyltransferase / 2-C-methyl-D-erythritol 2,4-cyclodiphosphate synthase
MRVSAIIAAGGTGTRLGSTQPKQLIELGGRTILQRSLDVFISSPRIDDVVVALAPDLLARPPAFLVDREKPVVLVAGGARRQDSVASAVAALPPDVAVVVIHDAARPFVTQELIARTIDAAAADGAAIAAVPAQDTVKHATASGLIDRTLPRDEIYLAQTPQAFRREVLMDAIAKGRSGSSATDEAALAEEAGHPVRLVEGDRQNIKITTPSDLAFARGLIASGVNGGLVRIGAGYDLHRLVERRPLVLGGVHIPFAFGLKGHSDADAVCHAVTDAVLGAAAAGDIGTHFPDTDPRWAGASSLELLRKSAALVRERGFAVENVDVVIIAERPKMLPHVAEMARNLGAALGIDPARVSIKGKTNEGIGELGRGEAIAVHAVALLRGA